MFNVNKTTIDKTFLLILNACGNKKSEKSVWQMITAATHRIKQSIKAAGTKQLIKAYPWLYR
jgi:hypothetical protein